MNYNSMKIYKNRLNKRTGILFHVKTEHCSGELKTRNITFYLKRQRSLPAVHDSIHLTN